MKIYQYGVWVRLAIFNTIYYSSHKHVDVYTSDVKSLLSKIKPCLLWNKSLNIYISIYANGCEKTVLPVMSKKKEDLFFFINYSKVDQSITASTFQRLVKKSVSNRVNDLRWFSKIPLEKVK